MRIVSGGRWTIDGRWVVVAQMIEGGPEVIVCDPGNGVPGTLGALLDLADCRVFIKEHS